MKTKFFCIHGHFYQPSRNNPWTLSTEREESAFPHKNWNYKILHECYLKNAFSEVESLKKPENFINNYSWINFDFGPTLLDWLYKYFPRLYNAVLEADRESEKNFSSPSAIAQTYTHLIMPLASLKDKKTQIRWGLEYFKEHFKRDSEGIWLPETAVDYETLESLCEAQIKYTLLSSEQAKSFRKIGLEKWETANKINFDPTMPHRWFSKQQPGKYIDIFFFHSELSKNIIPHLQSTENYFEAILSAFSKDTSHQLISIASDGENYGHHLKTGSKALSEMLLKIRKEKKFQISNYSSFLAQNPPIYEVDIFSPSSWSCTHGIKRWKENCGCRINPKLKDQNWRKILRETLNWLALKIDEIYENNAVKYFPEPWETRNRYISALGKTPHDIKRFVTANARYPLQSEEIRNALKLLEMQKNRMMMFTSCAWFFDDITDIPAINSIKFALRAIDISSLFSESLIEEFIERISFAKSNFSKNDIRGIVTRLWLQRENKARQAAIFAYSVFLNFNPPLSDWGRYHFKVIDEAYLKTSKRHAYLINVKTADTLDWGEFAIIISQPQDNTKIYVIRCESFEVYDKIKSATGIEQFMEIAGKDKIEVFDFSSFPAEKQQIFFILQNRFPKDEPQYLISKYLHLVKNITTGEILSAEMPDILSEMQSKIKPRDLPYKEDVINAFISQFEFLLETTDPKIGKTVPWLNYLLKEKSCDGYILAIKYMFSRWQNEHKNSPIRENFIKELRKITEILQATKTYGNQAIKTQ